jgi:hypothetical protein
LAAENERQKAIRFDAFVSRNIYVRNSSILWKSFLNDVLHMNLKVAAVPVGELAKRNVADLATIGRELFGYHINHGSMVPEQPKYWDHKPDGTVPVFLRLE